MYGRSISVLMLVACLGAAPAGESIPAEQLRQGEVRQYQIRTQTQQVSQQLERIIDEFQRNRLNGQDVQVLEAIRSVLDKLTERDMQRVIELLQMARSASDPGLSRRHVAGAVADQKVIVVQLRQLLLEYQRQQALYELSLRLAALAERQNANLKATVELVRIAQDRTGSQFDDAQRASLQVQVAEQQALKDETLPLLQKLQGLAQESEGPVRQRLEEAMRLANQGPLRPALESAIEKLKGAFLFDAAGSQKIARDELRQLARLVAPPREALEALRQAAAEIEKAIEQQKQIIADTRSLSRQPDRQRASELLEARQAELVDTTDRIRSDVENAAPNAAAELKKAIEPMQQARGDLKSQNREQALRDQQEALVRLESARDLLRQAMAKTEPSGQYDDRLAAARDLQQRTRELIRNQQEIQQATASSQGRRSQLRELAPRQGQLEERARQLQKDAAAQVPEAAPPIGDAASQMDRSEQRLTRADDPNAAQDAQAAAIASLKQADELLGRRISELEKTRDQLAAAIGARQRVQKLISQQQDLELGTGRAAAAQELRKRGAQVPPAPQSGQLADSQGRLADDTRQVRNDLKEVERSAGPPLEQARQNMSQAQERLQADNPAGAQPPQKEALANLFRAKDALDQQIQQLQRELGQKPQSPASMADLAGQIRKLKDAVDLASEQVSGDEQAVVKSLQQQQREIADSLQQIAGSPESSPQLVPAQKAASAAADHLGTRRFGQAAASMGQARQGMQAAMSAPLGTRGPQASLPELSQRQQELENLARMLAAGQQIDPMQHAAADFERAARNAGRMASSEHGQLPGSAVGALAQAAADLSNAMSAAALGNAASASALAASAQQAISRAAAALTLSQAGLSGQLAQGQGQQAQQGQGQQAQGFRGQMPGQPAPFSRSSGTAGSRGGALARGQQSDERSTGVMLTLPDRDRAALLQSQNEKYPQEYAPQIEQYLRNLSETGQE